MANKILIVDDDPNNLEVVLEFLSDKPDELLYAPNGKRAIELAIQELPDLILMDWEMPVLNGLEAVKELQSNPYTKHIPIIIATGVMLEPQNLEEALDTGAVDFLRKPFNPIEFNARIRANLRIKQQHETITQLLEKEKLLMHEALERKDRELTSAALFEHEKNNMIVKLLEELDKLSGFAGNGVSSHQLNQIKRELKKQLNLDKSWNSFKIHFEEVHPNFFDKLIEEFGSLSLNEKKMCAYLKIGLDNKEIALLTNVVVGSVRKSLNRLKKKLNLEIEDSLRDFIASF
jgi:CheY-like chemotaxis protein